MKRKVVGFIVCMLLITVTNFSVVGINEKINSSNKEFIRFNLEHSSPLEGLFEWPMFRHDLNNTGYSPSLAPDDDTVLWSKDICYWLDSNPTIKDERLYIACDTFKRGGEIYCLNPFNGTVIWQTVQPSDEIFGSPTVANGRVYVLGTYYYLYCYDAYTGDILWRFQADGHCSPMVVDDKVYFGSDWYKGFHCLNATTGEEIWVHDPITAYPGCTPAIADGKVYIGNGFFFYCLNAETGAEIWNSSNQCYWASPAVINDKVYINSDKFYCLDADTGDELWTYPIGDYHSSPAVAYGYVYVPANDGRVYALDADTGDLIWDSQSLGTSIWNAPAVADGKVYIASCGTPGKFNCLNAYTGDIIWQFEISSSDSSPAVAYGNVYAGSSADGYIYAFGTPNEPPEIPSKPNGPTNGVINIEYEFSTSTEDPEGDDIYYLFDWDDGTNSDWQGPYASGAIVDASHMWTEIGDYEIRAKAHDGRRESNWSDSHKIKIVAELKPILDIDNIRGGLFKVKAKIKNEGSVAATGVQWSIKLEGGAFIGKETSGTDDIPASGEITATSSLIIGFGATVVTVTAEIPESSDIREQDGFVFLIFIKVNPSG